MTCYKYQVCLYGSEAITYLNVVQLLRSSFLSKEAASAKRR
jgi:hypothetical protein